MNAPPSAKAMPMGSNPKPSPPAWVIFASPCRRSEAGGEGFGFEAIGIALALGGAFMRLGLENFGAFQFHGVVQEDAKGFGQALESIVGQMLRD